jgi:hypothetical protein
MTFQQSVMETLFVEEYLAEMLVISDSYQVRVPNELLKDLCANMTF